MREDTLEHALPNLVAFPDTVILHAAHGQFLFFFLQPPDTRARGQAWEDEVPAESDRKTDNTIYNEDPAPFSILVNEREEVWDLPTILACQVFHQDQHELQPACNPQT